MKSICLKPAGNSRVLAGHPWAFAGEIARHTHNLADGDSVMLHDAQRNFIGSGLWSNRSQIAWRRYSYDEQPFDENYIANALRRAISRRPQGPFQRLVWSEADAMPGLVVDRFDKDLVVQALTVGADRALPQIIAALKNLLRPREIILRNDNPSRRHDGLPLDVRTASGMTFAPGWYTIDSMDYHLDLCGGQKTGFYLDQRHQHTRVAQYAAGRRVLDGFCNQGGFALQAARAGATEVLAIDSSAECVEAVARNAQRNNLADRIHPLRSNMFDWFTAQRERGYRDAERFDLVILDPPPFARNREAMDGALRGYKEINLRAMHTLTRGGILATYSCSQRVSTESFLNILADAAANARRSVRLLEVTSQPADHPILLNFPESHYLKGAILQVD